MSAFKPCPLHNHSFESTFDGMSSMEEIMVQTKAIGSDSVALTDHGTVSGHLAFAKAAEKAGIHPIFGIEAYQARDLRKNHHKDGLIRNSRPKDDAFHLILLAENDIGLKNIWTLSSLAHATGFYHRPRVDWELLAEYSEGVIATSACLGSYVSKEVQEDRTHALENYLKIFGDRFFIELHTYDSDFQAEVNIALVALAKKHGLPVVYATDAHYACEDQYEIHEDWLRLRRPKKDDGPSENVHPPSLWIKGEPEIRKSLSYLPKSVVDEAIQNSALIAERCQVTVPGPIKRIPTFIPAGRFEDRTRLGIFFDLIEEGYKAKVEHLDSDGRYFDRVAKEMKVIIDADLVDFFLITWDVIQFSDQMGILRGPGRGSVGGSLVAYLLGITDIDPIRHDLIFERFYNAGREKGGLPDIDTDFPIASRPLIEQYLAERYGEDRVARLGTSLKLHGRSVIRRVGKLLRLPEGDISTMSKIVERLSKHGQAAKWSTIIESDEMQPWIGKYPRLFELGGKYEGRTFGTGTHASGYLVSNESLHQTFPLKYYKGELSTQFDMGEAEYLGFMKMDFLALRNLDTLTELMKILEDQGRPWDCRPLHHRSEEELRNEEFWTLLDKGMTVGIFQIEEGEGARNIARRMKPRSLEDLGIIVALNRPGPDSDLYLSRRETGEWERNEFTDDITGDTFGTFVYQEQIIRLMTKLGFSLERADDVRRFMGKKKVDDMKAFYPEFMAAAAKHMEQYEAQRLWDDVEIFASYGFNKSHSIGYAIIQLWTLVAKYTYPAEFMLACIRTDPEGAHRYISEALRMGIEVLPPDVNASGFETELVDGKIIYGLKNVKGVASGAEWVVENRPFTSHKQMVELLEEQNKAYLKAKRDGEKVPATSPKQRFNAGKINALLNVGAFDKLGDRPEITDAEKRAFERDLLGVVLTDSTPAIFEKHDELIEANCNSYEELIDADEGDEFLIPGVITEITESKTRRNETMARMKMEFGGRRTEVTVWPKLLSRYSYMLKEYIAVVAEVKIGNRGTPELKRVMELT